jgi:signal transduction histidine kinase
LRIAREVHDVIAHSVSAISIQSVVGLEALPDEPDNAAAALRHIRKVSGSALAELRSAVGVLREAAEGSIAAGSAPAGRPRADLAPVGGLADLAPVGGLADLDGLVATAADNGLQVTVIPVGSTGSTGDAPNRPVPVVVDATAHRIVQESITNILRHSNADRAVVEVEYRPTEVRLRISNTAAGQLIPAGPGHPVRQQAGASTGGFGIAGMRERVELLGGSLSAAPTGDSGFVVDAVLPFPALAQ